MYDGGVPTVTTTACLGPEKLQPYKTAMYTIPLGFREKSTALGTLGSSIIRLSHDRLTGKTEPFKHLCEGLEERNDILV